MIMPDTFEGYFSSALKKAAESCDIALSDLLTNRRPGEEGKTVFRLLAGRTGYMLPRSVSAKSLTAGGST